MKFALLQLNLLPGDIRGNAAHIVEAARNAAANGADICLTPALALCGQNPHDLLRTEGFLESCRTALHTLARELQNAPPVLVGAPIASFMPDDGVRSAAVLLREGKVSVVAHKPLSSAAADSGASSFEQGFAHGLITAAGWRISVILCDAPWEERLCREPRGVETCNPLDPTAIFEADVLAHLGAVPFTLGIQREREQRLSLAALRRHIPIFSVNHVGGDGEDIYHGRSLAISAEGLVTGRGKNFEQDCLIIDVVEKKTRQLQQREEESEEEELWGALCLGVRDYVRKSGFTGVTLGLSGGLDSSVTAAIAVDALGEENVLGVLLPSPWTSETSLRCAEELADNLGLRRITLPITPLMDAYATSLAPAFALRPADPQSTAEENIQARIRCTLLMALANRHGLLLLNTSNKSEAAVGYSTLYGDATGALSVLGDVYKTKVYALARRHNAKRGRDIIPQAVINRPPSAELKADQLDSDALPPYETLDPLLARLMGETPLTGAHENSETCFDAALLRGLHAKMCSSEFKRRQFPPILRVSKRVLGRNWRLPLLSAYTMPEEEAK